MAANPAVDFLNGEGDGEKERRRGRGDGEKEHRRGRGDGEKERRRGDGEKEQALGAGLLEEALRSAVGGAPLVGASLPAGVSAAMAVLLPLLDWVM